MPNVEWSSIDRSTFERFVEAHIVAEYTRDGLRARAIRGDGGDRGIDIGVFDAADRPVTIFQLKHYPDGWPSRRPDRRRHIRESYERAVREHAPKNWILVTPSNPSLSELEYVLGLGSSSGTHVDVLGAAELDALASARPHITDYYFADHTLQYLNSLHRPEEALQHVDDVSQVLTRIYQRVSARSQFWGFRSTLHVDGSQEHTLVALRSDAAEVEPLSFTIQTVLEDRADLREQLQQGMDWGWLGEVTIPADTVLAVRRDGPPWWAGEWGPGSISFRPTEGEPSLSVVIRTRSENGRALGVLNGHTIGIAVGSRGGQVQCEMEGGLNVTWRLPHDADATGNLVSAVDLSGETAHSALRLLRFLTTLRSCSQLELQIGDHEPIALVLSMGQVPEVPGFIMSLLRDLVAIEEITGVLFQIPQDDPITVEDRLWARILLRILEGRAVPYPDIDGYNFTLNGKRDIAASLRVEFAAALLQTPNFTRNIFGTEVEIGTVFLYQQFGHILDGPAHAAALEAGKGKGRNVHLRGVDDLPFVLYAPERVTSLPGEPQLVGWGIDDVPEHAMLDELVKRRTEYGLPTTTNIRS